MRIPAVDLTMSEPSSVFSTSESMSISATMALTSIRFDAFDVDPLDDLFDINAVNDAFDVHSSEQSVHINCFEHLVYHPSGDRFVELFESECCGVRAHQSGSNSTFDLWVHRTPTYGPLERPATFRPSQLHLRSAAGV